MTSDRNDSVKSFNHWDSFLPDISASSLKSNYAKLLARSIVYIFLFCMLQGFSPKWWNDLHFRHHSKPNVVSSIIHLNISCLLESVDYFS